MQRSGDALMAFGHSLLNRSFCQGAFRAFRVSESRENRRLGNITESAAKLCEGSSSVPPAQCFFVQCLLRDLVACRI